MGIARRKPEVNPAILPARRRFRRLRKAAAIAGVALLSVLSAGTWWMSAPWSAEAQETAVGIHRVHGATWKPELGQPLFLAVMGSDARSGPPEAGGGCDSVHILAINPQTKGGTILNFPRDSYLPAPGGASRKITDTCRTAGFEPVIQILRSTTGINIQFYARTEFSHFMALIDELGGIDVEVPYPMNDSFSGARFGQGLLHMNGGQALAFTRNRHDTPKGDFSRTENQGLLMIAALRKFRTEASDPHRLLDYVRVARRHVRLTIPITDLVKMGLLAVDVDPANIQNLTIPGSTGGAGGASVVFLAPGDIYQRVRDDAIY